MKKSFISLGLIVAATFALTNCTKEFENPSDKPETAGVPFELTASTPDTKTANNGLLTEWKANDALTVIHVEHTEPVTAAFVGNDSFTITAENMSEKKFTGNLTGSLESGKSYDWHVFYPYNGNYGAAKLAEGKIGYTNYGSTCYDNEVSTAQSQKGNDSKAHLAGDKFPLYGVKKNVASENEVSVEMNHLMSVIEVEVTNATTEPVTVTEIHFSAPYYLVGSFYYDTVNGVYEPSQNDGKYNSKTAKLSVSNADPIAVGEEAKFYIGIVPVSITGAEDEISMTVITDKGTQIKTKTNPNISFAAGTIKKIAFTYDAAVAVKTVSLPWTEDFSSEDLTNYTIVSTASVTKLYDANLAGGTAPELLIAKSGGALTANVDVDGYSGNLTLTFKCNYPERISVTSETSGVVISKKSNVEYQLDVDESVDVFELKLTNTSGSNARIDDVLLVKGVQQAQTLTFEQSELSFYIGSDEAAAFTGQVVQGAKTTVTYSSNNEAVASVDPETGVVTLKDVEGTATITARAVATAEYKEATATYSIAVSESNTGGEQVKSFTVKSDDVVNNSGYKSYSTTIDSRGWIITFGGNQKSVGTNSSNRSKCNLSDYKKYAVSPVTTSSTSSAFASTTSIENVSKISYAALSGGSNQSSTKIYVLYSADGNTFSQLSLTKGTQGGTISASSGGEFEFAPCSGYFAVVFVATNTSGNWRLDDVNLTFTYTENN